MGQPTADAVADIRAASDSIAVIHALAIERAGLEDADGELTIRQCGPGAERARRAAGEVLGAGAGALVSWGLAGGLEPGVGPGAVVVPGWIATADGGRHATDPAWRAALIAALEPDFDVHGGGLLSTDRVLASPRDKARAALATRTVAVDLESAAIAAAAAAAGRPFVAIRVVVDGVADALPAEIERWVGESGERRLAPVVRAALAVKSWPTLLLLAQRYRVARGVLAAVAEQLVARGFARPA